MRLLAALGILLLLAAGTGLALRTMDEPAEATDRLLALSWQPAFCEDNPRRDECEALNAGRLPLTETQLSLHGLWPQPRGTEYCGVSSAVREVDRAGRWSDLPAPELDADTAARLDEAMPGRASHLDRHEWIRHGTCFHGGGADAYFDDTLQVLDAVNAAVGPLFAEHLGRDLSAEAIAAAFDGAFGAGAGARVRVSCTNDRGKRLIDEITIALKGEIAPGADIGALIRAAGPQRPDCPGGLVDPAGLQ